MQDGTRKSWVDLWLVLLQGHVLRPLSPTGPHIPPPLIPSLPPSLAPRDPNPRAAARDSATRKIMAFGAVNHEPPRRIVPPRCTPRCCMDCLSICDDCDRDDMGLGRLGRGRGAGCPIGELRDARCRSRRRRCRGSLSCDSEPTTIRGCIARVFGENGAGC